jgi:AraC family transcriptional regulator, transcriptional activator of pobA
MFGFCGTIFGFSWACNERRCRQLPTRRLLREGIGLGRTRVLGKKREGPPVYTFEAVLGAPPVNVLRLLGRERPLGLPPTGPPTASYAHSHDFLVLAYVERGGGSLRLGEREWPVEAGDAYVISPGEVVGVGDADGFEGAEGWAAFFPPEVLGSEAPGAFLSWRAHPLLFPFVRGMGNPGAQRLRVPPEERASWSGRFAALDAELRRRRDGYREALLAHLTLLLVELSRLTTDVVGDLRLKDEPLLAEVFGFIEERYRQQISLKDVARAMGLSPGHLTTVVGRKTGRTVLEWIAERRMAEARRLLVETDLPVEEVGQRVGYADAHYFVRVFRRGHGATPLGWRRAGQP